MRAGVLSPQNVKLTREQIATAIQTFGSAHLDLSGRDLAKLDLSGLNFIGANLSSIIGTESNFSRCYLDGVLFIGAKLDHADFQVETINGADFSQADLVGSKLKFNQRDISNGAIFKGAKLQGVDFANLDLTAFYPASSRQGNPPAPPFPVPTPPVYINDAKTPFNFEGADLAAANFQNARLPEVNFNGANLRSANFSGARLASLVDVVIVHGQDEERMEGAASLRQAALIEVLASKTNFSGCDLTEADLTRAGLTGANLSGAKLDKARLVGADLSSANLQDVSLRGATYSVDTKWPRGADPSLVGAILVQQAS
jgi:uncharacterized protein YjbI with pentapeptide repeats